MEPAERVRGASALGQGAQEDREAADGQLAVSFLQLTAGMAQDAMSDNDRDALAVAHSLRSQADDRSGRAKTTQVADQMLPVAERVVHYLTELGVPKKIKEHVRMVALKLTKGLVRRYRPQDLAVQLHEKYVTVGRGSAKERILQGLKELKQLLKDEKEAEKLESANKKRKVVNDENEDKAVNGGVSDMPPVAPNVNKNDAVVGETASGLEMRSTPLHKQRQAAKPAATLATSAPSVRKETARN